MITLTARNVHRALPMGIRLLQQQGTARPSRVGKMVESLQPVATVYLRPDERVLFWPERDANPFFHLFESLWMLGGRRDVKWISRFNSRMTTFSDDGETFHGAYGYRWRSAFGDQFEKLLALLAREPETRRAVLQMWDAPLDLNVDSKDLPCNTQVYFLHRDGELRMTVTCRSNDIVWGAYGTNAVHFSILQEYIAERCGWAVGSYTHLSNSFHAYEGVWEKLHGLPLVEKCPYQKGEVRPYPLGAGDRGWDEDLAKFLSEARGLVSYKTKFFGEVVDPLEDAWTLYKEDDLAEAIRLAAQCAATDWRRAAVEWLQRRLERRAQ